MKILGSFLLVMFTTTAAVKKGNVIVNVTRVSISVNSDTETRMLMAPNDENKGLKTFGSQDFTLRWTNAIDAENRPAPLSVYMTLNYEGNNPEVVRTDIHKFTKWSSLGNKPDIPSDSIKHLAKDFFLRVYAPFKSDFNSWGIFDYKQFQTPGHLTWEREKTSGIKCNTPVTVELRLESSLYNPFTISESEFKGEFTC